MKAPHNGGLGRPPTAEVLGQGVLTLSCGLFALLQVSVAMMLPHFRDTFEVSTADTAWLVSGHLLVASVATPLAGRLGDLYGRRRVLLALLGVIAAAGVVAALTSSFGVLLAARLTQGVAGGLFPLAVGLLREGFPGRPLAVPLGVLSSSFGLGGAGAVALVALLNDGQSGYRTLFATGSVLAVAVLVLGALVLPETPRRSHQRLDAPGLLLLAAASVLLLLGLGEFGRQGGLSRTGSALVAGAALGVVALLAWERRSSAPMLDLRLMSRRPIWTLNVVSLLTGLVMFVTNAFVPLLLEAPRSTGYGFDADGTAVVLVMMPLHIATLVGGLLSGALSRALTPRTAMLSATVMFMASAAALAFLSGSLPGLALGTALTGLGTGVLGGAMTELIARASPAGTTGVVVGMNSLLRNLGASFGVQAGSVVLAASATTQGLPAGSSYTAVFVGTAALGSLAVLAGCAFPRSTPAREHQTAAPPRPQSRASA